ncbi:MAG: ATP-binding protein [Acidimicrobiales bacterium]
MRRRLLAGFLLFALVFAALLEVPLGLSLARNARTTALSELQNDGSSLALLVGSALGRGSTAEAQALISRFALDEHAIVVVVSGGKLQLSAGSDAAEEMGDPATRAILARAALGRASGEEGSQDPDDDLLYVALPVVPASTETSGPTPGVTSAPFGVVLLVAEQAGPLHARIRGDWVKLGLFGAAMLAVAAAVGTLLARSLTKTLAGIETAVAAFGAGSLSERVPDGRGPAELRALGDTVNEMADRLEELLHTQRAFVADASHQLRTPMTALRLRLENLEGDLDPAAGIDLAPAIAETDRLSRVVDGLLSLARTEGARPVRQPVDVGLALRERLEAWSALAEERQVSLADDSAAAAPGQGVALSALACPGHVEQVLDNLLSNALDATPPGGRVSLSARRLDDGIEIHVVDTGPGMSAADRARAFDRFWRREGAQHAGSGLGLAIVAQLVRVSGGRTWLEAAPGGGVDAVVRLEAR